MSRRMVALFAITSVLGCSDPYGSQSGSYSYGSSAATTIRFKDDVTTNIEAPAAIAAMEFIGADAARIKLADYHGQRNVVLVFTRGFSGAICPYCTAQTSRLISNYDAIQARDAEVLLVYPGEKSRVDQFLAAVMNLQGEVTDVPFPILLDEDLAAVNFLKIAANLANPSTFIIDKQGNVRFAYVGKSLNDRPSISALLGHLDRLQ